jgi:hypothetical protein
MKRGIIYVVAAVIVVAGLGAAVTRLRQPARQLAADLKIISADTVDVMSSAVYRRFARRREAVGSMRSALLQVAAIESMFVADSGRPTTSLFGRYVPNDQYIFGPSVEIQRDRWVAKVSHQNATMSCTLTAMVDPTTFDSTIWRYHAGEPVCTGWTAESTALANAPVPINPAPEPDPPAQPLRAPRHHHDWGPVNNTPPSMPYIVKNACEGEGCARSGTWAACSDVAALRDKRLDAPMVFTIHGGDKFTALTIDLHVEVSGMVVFRHPMSNTPEAEGNEVDSIAFTPADTLYLLNSHGEGYLVWWFRGQLGEGYQFWRDIDEDEVTKYPPDTAVLARRPKTIHWVRARNAAGQEGWIVGDYQKMATGGYMDEIERCLHPAKR